MTDKELLDRIAHKVAEQEARLCELEGAVWIDPKPKVVRNPCGMEMAAVAALAFCAVIGLVLFSIL